MPQPNETAAVFILLCICMASPLVSAESPSFNKDVVPVLTRFGCNAGGCHGKLSGQNGFRLSLRGYAPELDHETITREAFGRRINAASPEQSLLIRKAGNLVPHGGGQRLEIGGKAEQILTDWIAAGAPGPRTDEADLLRIEVAPESRTLSEGESHPLSVTAVYVDGQRQDVTWLTQFASSDSGVSVENLAALVRSSGCPGSSRRQVSHSYS